MTGFIGVSTIFIACSSLSSALPILLKNAANAINEIQSAQTQFLVFASAYAILWTASQILSNVRGVFSAWILAKCDATLYEEIVSRVFRYSHRKQQTLDPGYIVADINRSAGSFSMVTIGIFWTIVPIALEMIIAMSVLFTTMGYFYAILFFVFCIGLILIAVHVAKSSSHIHKSIFEADNELSSYTIQRLGRIYDIRLNNSLPKELLSGRSFFDKYVKTIRKANLHMGMRLGLQGLAIGTTLTFFVILSGMSDSTRLTAGDFVMIVGYITMFTMQLHILAGTLINLQANLVSLNIGIKYIEENINKPYYPNKHKDTLLFSLHGVSLTKDNKIILSSVSYKFGPGIHIISGRSGTEKTTLINTLLGFEDSYKGTAHYKGHPIDESLSEYILSEVSVVPQNPVLLPGTLKDNLLYGTESASPQKLALILELLGFSRDNADIEALLSTAIDISGGGLSGGERQRIAIGRAILREKTTIILDEPTSALDRITAKRIMDWLLANIPCLIIVTHDELLKKKYGVAIEL